MAHKPWDKVLFDNLSLREKCPYSELFWSVFSRIWTEYEEILVVFFRHLDLVYKPFPKFAKYLWEMFWWIKWTWFLKMFWTPFCNIHKFKSSRSEVFLKICKIYKEALVLESLFNKKDSCTDVFDMNLVKILGTTFFIDHLWRLLL